MDQNPLPSWVFSGDDIMVGFPTGPAKQSHEVITSGDNYSELAANDWQTKLPVLQHSLVFLS